MSDKICLISLNTFISFIGATLIVIGSIMSEKDMQAGNVMSIIGWLIFTIAVLHQSNKFISLRNILSLIAILMIIAGSYMGKMSIKNKIFSNEILTKGLFVGGWILLTYAMSINDSRMPNVVRLLFLAPGAAAIIASGISLLKSQKTSGDVFGYGIPTLISGWMLVALGNSIV